MLHVCSAASFAAPVRPMSLTTVKQIFFSAALIAAGFPVPAVWQRFASCVFSSPVSVVSVATVRLQIRTPSATVVGVVVLGVLAVVVVVELVAALLVVVAALLDVVVLLVEEEVVALLDVEAALLLVVVTATIGDFLVELVVAFLPLPPHAARSPAAATIAMISG